MKITLVGPVYPYRGGIAHFTALLAQKMAQAGHQAQVISFSRQYPRWLYPGKTDRDPSRRPVDVPARFLLDSVNPLTWLSAADQIASSAPDLALVMWWSTFWGPADWALASRLKNKGIPVAYLIHNVLPHEAKCFDRALARLALGAGSRYLVLTGVQRERLCDLLPHARVIQATHPVYDVFNREKVEKSQARSALGLPQDAPVILFFGIVRPYKGLRCLFEAARLLKQQGRGIHLLVAGEFWEPEEAYRRLAEQSGLKDSVHLFNRYIPNEEVPLYFSAADVFAAPYISGTQSGVINIAISFGLPIVMTDIMIQSAQENYWPMCQMVVPGDSDALAKGILTYLDHPGPDRLSVPSPDESWGKLIAAIERLSM